MNELISGKEALIAVANGEEVEIKFNNTDGWNNINKKDAYSFEIFLDPIRTEFRLKPRTITINGIKVPAPFDPKEDEGIWVLSDMHNNGYMRSKHKDNFGYAFGAWRTEDEIKQVVVALRSVFNVK